jgi:DNA repair protein RadC
MLVENKKFNSSNAAYYIFKDFIGAVDREVFVVAMLDTRNNINSINMVSMGTLNSSLVHPREVFKPAILSNAASIIVAHNHPAGSLIASQADKEVTEKLVQAGKIVEIPILDHIIITDIGYYSFMEHGLM